MAGWMWYFRQAAGRLPSLLAVVFTASTMLRLASVSDWPARASPAPGPSIWCRGESIRFVGPGVFIVTDSNAGLIHQANDRPDHLPLRQASPFEILITFLP